MPPNPGEFPKYDELHTQIKDLPGVVDVVRGSKIDIILLRPPEDVSTLTDQYIQAQAEGLQELLLAMGVNINYIAFSCLGWKTPLRKKASTGRYEILSLDQVGIEALSLLKINVKGDIGSIIPPTFAHLPVYMGIQALPIMIHHLRRLNIDPHDVQEGNKFRLTTQSESVYVIQIDKNGMFEVTGGPALIGAKFYCFTEDGGLDAGDGRQSSPVKTMVKLSQ